MHVMLDLETMSSDSHAAIVSIGAVAFEPMQPIHQHHDYMASDKVFLANVQLAQQVRTHGRHMDGKTVTWWLGQSFIAQQALLHPEPILLKDALKAFNVWYKSEPIQGQKLWSHAMFDAVILCNAYDACDLSRPFSRIDCMDVRTMYSLAYPGTLVPGIPENNPHEAVWDCYRQIIGVQQCYRRLRGEFEALANIEAIGRARTEG